MGNPHSKERFDRWAIKNDYDMFVPRLNAAALASPDGHDPSSQTSAARAGTTTFHSGTVRPTSRFFTDDPNADTYDNATDKSAWLKETCSGRYRLPRSTRCRRAPPLKPRPSRLTFSHRLGACF